MPRYRYAVFDAEDRQVEIYEADAAVGALPLCSHPVTGERMERLYDAPNLVLRHSEQSIVRKLDDRELERKGFTKYVRDGGSGAFVKTNRGAGPEEIRPGSDKPCCGSHGQGCGCG